MKTSRQLSTLLSTLLLLALLLVGVPVPVSAQVSDTGSARSDQALPPLPEWPIIGPILQQLGVVEATEAPSIDPDPDLPEHRVSTFEDIEALREIEPGDRVRLIASEEDLNLMIDEALNARVGEDAEVVLDFEPNLVTISAQANEALVEELTRDMQGRLPARSDVDLETALSFEAADCALRADVDTMRINGWRFGLSLLAQRTINSRIPEVWPEEICVERVLMMQNEIAVEGYRR